MKYIILILLFISLGGHIVFASSHAVQLNASPTKDSSATIPGETDLKSIDTGTTLIQTKDVEVETTEGDPDRPVITGEAANTGSPSPEPKTTGIEHEDIGITSGDDSPDSSKKGNVETEFKVEKGESAAQNNESDLNFLRSLENSSRSGTSSTIHQVKPGNITGGEGKTPIRPEDDIMVLLRPAPGATDSEEGEAAFMNKADLLKALTEQKAVFIKLGDIKGESDDSSSEAKRPKEIVVVGSKARDAFVPRIVLPEDTALGSPDSFFDITIDVSVDDLQLFVVGTSQNDENIEEVTITDEEVKVRYKTTIDLFGIVPVETTHEASVRFGDGARGASESDKLGRVKVKLPWWHIFGRKTVRPADITSELETIAEEIYTDEFGGSATSDDRPTETIAINFAKVQAQTFQQMSSILKSLHDTAKSSINNIR